MNVMKKFFKKHVTQKANFWNVCFFKNNELKSFLVRVVNEKSMANQKTTIFSVFCVVFEFNKKQKGQDLHDMCVLLKSFVDKCYVT